MNSKIYPVIKIENPFLSNEEVMGGKEKFWCDYDGKKWLFKYPRPNTGEHWAEKIACEVARGLNINCAQVELAECAGKRGTISKNFLSPKEQLIHGNQILYLHDSDYNMEMKFGQGQHTLKNILSVLECKDEKKQFATYLLLDAVIGNTDRHHENWGMLFGRFKSTLSMNSDQSYENNNPHFDMGYFLPLAPTFDHASSMGRELTDTKREQFLREQRVCQYAQKAKGAIYLKREENRTPLRILQVLCEIEPDLMEEITSRYLPLQELLDSGFHEIIARVPEPWMSLPERNFVKAFLCYNVAVVSRLFSK